MTPRSVWTKTSLATFCLVALAAVGCKVNPTDPSNAKTASGAECKGPDGLIDDGDDNNNATVMVAGRGGYWYTFADHNGTEIWPTSGDKGGTFEMSPGGAASSPYAARFKGKVAVSEAPSQGGMGMNFLDPKGGYDASKYAGISFWAKAGAGSVTAVRLKLPDANTDPDGGVCSECFNDFGMDLTLTSEWQHFIIPFKQMAQMPGWGKPKKMSVDKTQLFGLQFQAAEPGKPFDIWVDQIRFTGCAAE